MASQCLISGKFQKHAKHLLCRATVPTGHKVTQYSPIRPSSTFYRRGRRDLVPIVMKPHTLLADGDLLQGSKEPTHPPPVCTDTTVATAQGGSAGDRQGKQRAQEGTLQFQCKA